ncbi:F-box-like domain superfamily [Arabidopsis suecica]|uniref:F-box-like domain superfamily n=1 Tax=Arabidopsis suecica TaxID=45249 RepID=A0A8T2H5B0_ARASU|nr:F-box-like domain superfamily [Arabidopsis suecica]
MKTRRNTRSCSNSRKREEKNSETIPFDLVNEILTRLPVKSIARFRCLSKLCASTLNNPDFTESFFTISSSRPKLLVTCPKDGETFFFSSPKPRDSSPLVVNFHMSFSINHLCGICRPVCGFIYGFNSHTNLKGRTISKPLICNPSTGESWPLPRVKTNRTIITSFFGYDPINKEFKVLCMTKSKFGVFGEHQVLTFGTGKELSWRKIKCDMAHYPEVVDYEASGYPRPLYYGICINGVLYYLGRVHDDLDGFPDMVCFDIKFEKFSYIKKANGMKRNSGVNLQPTLVNHKGKIAKLQANIGPGSIRYTGIQLWVLEDAKKHQWSSYIYVVPPPWKNIIEETKLRFVGTSDTGDIVLSPCNISNSFYLLYYDPERNAIARVEIQGMEAFKSHKSYAFLDYAENIVKPKPTRKL